MLTPPPCIEPLIGCSETDTSFGNPTSSSTANTPSPSLGSSASSSRSSSRTSLFQSTSSSSQPSFFASSVAGSSSRLASATTQRLAAYTVRLQSVDSAAKTVTVTHGPIPYGAVLDTIRSTKTCSENGVSVLCTVSVPALGTSDLSIVYVVPMSTSCALEPKLQSAAVSGDSSTIRSSVSCTMQNDAPSHNATNSSSFSSFSSSSSSYYSTGIIDTTVKSTIDATPALITTKDDGSGKGKGKGYKPYTPPRTGAASDFFSQKNSASLLSPAYPQHASVMETSSLWVLAIAGAVIAAVVWARFFRAKSA